MNHFRKIPKTILIRLGVLLFWGATILWLSLTPSPPPSPPSILSWDKLQHASAYALLTFFAGRVLVLFARSVYRGWLWALASAVLFGALVEIAQGTMTTARYADPADLLANFCGAAVVAGAAAGFRAWQVASGRAGRP